MQQLLDKLSRLGAQELSILLTGLIVALIVVLTLAVIVLCRRISRQQAETKRLSEQVASGLSQLDSRAGEREAQQKKEFSDAIETVSDSMQRIVGDMARTHQGQIDALGGQLRAAGRREEEQIERVRETLDHRLEHYEGRIGDFGQQLSTQLSGNEERMERMRSTLETSLDKLSEQNRSQLEQMRLTVDEKLNATVDRRLAASFEAVTLRLEQMTHSLAAMQTLAGSVDTLSRSLNGGQPLGAWGEIQLGALLSQMLSPDQYAQHACVRPGGEAVADYVVVMPGQSDGHTVYLPIDASLPMREYTELSAALESGTREEIESARGMLESAVRMHARRMSEKLIAPPYTTDYAVLFLGSEGLFSEVLRVSGLAQRIQQESRMVIAGPTTLSALLTSLQMGFRSLAIEQRTQEVSMLLSAVREDMNGFAGLLSRTQKRLRQASESIESAQRHSEHIARRLSDVDCLPATENKRLLGEEEDYDSDGDEWD